MTRSPVVASAVGALAWLAGLGVVLAAPGPGELTPDTPRGAWHAVLLVALVAVPGLALVALLRGPLRGPWWVVAGAVGGIAWGAALRGFMATVAGPESVVTWLGTFGFLLLPCAVAGGLLGYAEQRRRLGRPRRRLTLAPLVLAVDPSALLLVLPAMAGGWALAGRGTPRRRRLAWAAMVLPVATLLVVGMLVGGLGRLATPEGALAVVLFFACLAVLTLACSIPFRGAPPPRDEAVDRRGAGLTSAA